MVDFNHVSLVDAFLFIQVIHDKEVLSLVRGDVDAVDLIKVRLLIVDDIPKVVAVLKNILARVHEYFQLVCDQNLEGY